MKVRRRDAQALPNFSGRALSLLTPLPAPSRSPLTPVTSQAAPLAAWLLLALLAGSAAVEQAAPAAALSAEQQANAAAGEGLAADPLIAEAEEQYQQAVAIRCARAGAGGGRHAPARPSGSRGGGSTQRLSARVHGLPAGLPNVSLCCCGAPAGTGGTPRSASSSALSSCSLLRRASSTCPWSAPQPRLPSPAARPAPTAAPAGPAEAAARQAAARGAQSFRPPPRSGWSCVPTARRCWPL